MLKSMVIAVPLLALVPVTAAAQAGSGDPQERITAAMERASSAGIPLSLLEDKVAEGKAKGVPMDRIAESVEQRLDRLSTARAALSRAGHDPSPAELSIGAYAIGTGVSEAALAAVGDAPQERRVVAIAVLTELVSQGVLEEHALVQVNSALARGPRALEDLRAQAAANRGGRDARPAGGGRPSWTGRPSWGGRPGGFGGRPSVGGRGRRR